MHDATSARAKIGVAAVLSAALGSSLLLPGPAGASTTARITFGGHAYGSTVSVGSLARSGKTANVPLCTSKTKASHSDKTAKTVVPDLGTIGAVTTKMSATKHGSTETSSAFTKTGATSLLNGLIKARAITTTATQAKRGAKYTHGASTTVVGLTIAGRAITSHPAAGRKITVPGIGSLVLNAQSHPSSHGEHSSAVTGLELRVASNNTAGLGSGKVTIGRSLASLHSATYRRAYGTAFGTSLQLGKVAQSGRTAPVYLPCGGSGGSTRTNRTAGAHATGVLTTGAVTSTGRTTDHHASTTAATGNHIADVNLLGGVVTAKTLTTDATVTRGKHVTRSAKGTRVTGLKINGTAIATPTSSTSRKIAGVGTLYFDYQKHTRTSLQVYGLRLVLSSSQDGLAKGTVLTVGSAEAGVLA